MSKQTYIELSQEMKQLKNQHSLNDAQIKSFIKIAKNCQKFLSTQQLMKIYKQHGYQPKLLEDHIQFNYVRKHKKQESESYVISYTLNPDGSISEFSKMPLK